jgi:hypothetical protein
VTEGEKVFLALGVGATVEEEMMSGAAQEEGAGIGEEVEDVRLDAEDLSDVISCDEWLRRGGRCLKDSGNKKDYKI